MIHPALPSRNPPLNTKSRTHRKAARSKGHEGDTDPFARRSRALMAANFSLWIRNSPGVS
jgi:hypothetical protein